MYPMEYILLGRDPARTDFVVDIEHKLSTIVDGPTLRLFFWKLHNTVSSSIERTEPWYRRDPKAIYTTRYWPNLKSEIVHAKVAKEQGVSTSLVRSLYVLLYPMTVLGGLRRDFVSAGEEGSVEEMKKIAAAAALHIGDLEKEVMNGKFLEDTYHFNPTLVEKPALGVSVEETAWGLSGNFVAW